MLQKQRQRKRRHQRVRSKISGTAKVPRLCIFRSNKYIYAQLVDDESGGIVSHASGKKTVKGAASVGKTIAETAKAKKIDKVVFDRGGYKYHGRIKALAEEARKAGLKF